MKKKLNITTIENELRGNSPFFPTSPSTSQEQQNPLEQPVRQYQELDAISTSQAHRSLPADQRASDSTETKQASEKASIHASKHASTLASEIGLETIRKTLKLVGKEVLYVRLTPEEKNQVNDIEYTYQRQGIKTSGNEIGRIGINFLLADYRANGEQSILAKLLAALHT